jgi:hypothetical protein
MQATFLVCLCLIAAQPRTAIAGTTPASSTVFYVSTLGNDQWSGRTPFPAKDGGDGPLATLAAARDAIRRLKSANRFTAPMEVMVLDGVYSLSEPLILTSDDSGTEEFPITYTAYPGHHPVLSGGKAIGDWKSFHGKIMETHLPEVKAGRWKFRQLFYRGERQVRARWPNSEPADPLYSGWAFIGDEKKDELTHRYDADQPPQEWARPEQAEMHVFPWDRLTIPTRSGMTAPGSPP